MSTVAYVELRRLLTEHATWRDPNPERAGVTALEHACQAATRARLMGVPEDGVAAALVHDAARPLSEIYHGEVIAEMMRGRLNVVWVQALRVHGLFQSDAMSGDHRTAVLRRRVWYPQARQLAAWDAASFDPDFTAQPLEAFDDLLAKVMR